MAATKKVTKEITTGIGTLSFPKVFKSTAGKKDDGSPDYNIQIIIPKAQKADIKAILIAIKQVGEAQWGDKWRSVRNPLRDGDKEADDLTEDGSTKGEKYPERLGCFFLNARSGKPVGVYGRDRSPITEESDLYGGCKGKIAVSFYPYSTNGNHGIGAGLNGVQKIADGEPFGGGAPPVESMFDILDDEDEDGLDDIDLEDEVEEVEEPVKKKAPAKKAAAKRKAKPAPVEEEDEDDDLLDEFDDLDDSDD